MEQNNQIFLNNEENNEHSSPEQIKYIHNTQSDDYISQFLWEEGSQEMSRLGHESAPIQMEKILQGNTIAEQKPENQKKKPKREKSLFHNFQKHLVITLKKIVRIKPKPEEGLVGKVAQEMWEIFLKSHLYTKTILHILYGAEQQQQECSFTSAMLNRFGYVDLFNKYSEDLVKEGQNYLRQETVKALKRVNIKQYLNKRRLSKSEQFEDYLTEFIEQLSQGPIKRRIPKQKKKHLKAYQKSMLKASGMKTQIEQN